MTGAPIFDGVWFTQTRSQMASRSSRTPVAADLDDLDLGDRQLPGQRCPQGNVICYGTSLSPDKIFLAA